MGGGGWWGPLMRARLEGDLDERHMEKVMVMVPGLWCAHPDYNKFRPAFDGAGVDGGGSGA